MQTPPTDTASLLAGPLAGHIIKVPEGDGQSESRGTAMNKDEKDSVEDEVEEEEEGAGEGERRHGRWRGSISGRGCYEANNRRLKRKNKGLAVHHNSHTLAHTHAYAHSTIYRLAIRGVRVITGSLPTIPTVRRR
ncbi:hypothetical protein ALC53_09528 [Atta colombica]|uniref:Uncharacterized protein n=1 Tax=Atta colombica TaxID=520822 RepID=A0A195B6W3_9HYME|nr:hypothetical protein ALC53_09528 [Atta colombica]